jgi:hypothetical protein
MTDDSYLISLASNDPGNPTFETNYTRQEGVGNRGCVANEQIVELAI